LSITGVEYIIVEAAATQKLAALRYLNSVTYIID